MFKLFQRPKDTTNDRFDGIEIGDEVQCTLTKFAGVVVARAEYITGCNQVCIQPVNGPADEYKSAHWFDVERVETIAKAVVTPSARLKGADVAPPPSRSPATSH